MNCTRFSSALPSPRPWLSRPWAPRYQPSPPPRLRRRPSPVRAMSASPLLAAAVRMQLSRRSRCGPNRKTMTGAAVLTLERQRGKTFTDAFQAEDRRHT